MLPNAKIFPIGQEKFGVFKISKAVVLEVWNDRLSFVRFTHPHIEARGGTPCQRQIQTLAIWRPRIDTQKICRRGKFVFLIGRPYLESCRARLVEIRTTIGSPVKCCPRGEDVEVYGVRSLARFEETAPCKLSASELLLLNLRVQI